MPQPAPRKPGGGSIPLQRWALQTEQRVGRNKATVALANKIARVLWAMARYQRAYDPNYLAPHDH